ncbi:transcriptional regulator, TetR family [Desulfatibacillum alkenivorans DSM 16219]|jgi:AcrR family transcriptional regulator|uniref:Transcriptional regulator, TetR family n=1 Tax=Desulfatibacillum alkenivorans DSM 16219 TaxID=1121393 RepID=A0A1M6HBH5_9BACT|nr:TetR/AcrR family transcriptional regulator [Desulfatibacillum alkenivorans]SHJ19496.1 transcriptional regulator, TetR family [Desulfatibacillum alkenivorans DSM 16219]
MGRISLAQTRRNQIIQAFYRCVASLGLAKTSMRAIAKEAGVQPSALHHYFKDRDEMIEEMVEFYTDRFFHVFLEEMARYDDVKERLDKAAEFLFSTSMINEEATSFFYDCCAEAKNNPRVRQSLAKLFRRFRKTILEYFSDLAIQSGLTPQETQDIATLIIAVHEGIELQWHMSPEDVSLERSLLLAKRIIKTFLLGQGREGLRRAV